MNCFPENGANRAASKNTSKKYPKNTFKKKPAENRLLSYEICGSPYVYNINDKNVTFMHKDYADGARQKPITLDGVEFLRRFCMHILPHRFVKIRRYGIYSNRARALKQKGNTKMVINLQKEETVQQRIQRLTGFDVYLCPFCKQGIMHRIEDMPRVRSPANLYPQAGTGQQ